jgi:superfamily II DNA/RNA helicase
VAERELRAGRASGSGPGLSREQRKAPFKLGAPAAKPRGPREDSVQQLREREASLAALPLPLPVASNAHPFRALGLSAEAGEGLQLSGVSRPTPIQQLAIPALVQGTSTAVLAETGSGKTLAYCLPLATRLYAYAQLGKAHAMRRVPATACPEALIIVPNRELGVQVAASARAAAEWCQPDNEGPGPGTRPLCIVTLLGKDKMSSSKSGGGGSGGRAAKPSAASLAGAWGGGEDGSMGDMATDGAAFEAADIVIATPRTVLQLQKAGRLRLGRCRTVVLDEADELLSAGFVDDVAAVVRSAAGEAGVGVFGQTVQVRPHVLRL